MPRIGKLQYEILVILSEGRCKPYGLEIQKTLSLQRGKEVSITLVYRTLGRLAENSLISSRLSENFNKHGGKRQRLYTIEYLGKEAIKTTRRRLYPPHFLPC